MTDLTQHLADSSKFLSELWQTVLDMGNLDEFLTSELSRASLNVSGNVDRCLSRIDAIEADLDRLKKNKDLYQAAYKRLDDALFMMRSKIKDIVAQSGMPFEGDLGTMSVQRSGASLDLIPETRKYTYSNCLNTEDIEYYSIPQKYLNHITVMTLNTDAVKKDLEKGEVLSWAKLHHGTHLVVRRK